MAKYVTFFVLTSSILVASAEFFDHYSGDDHGGYENSLETKKDYNFDYTVHDPHSELYSTRQESSKDGVVRGYYSYKEADGSLREVHYTADPVHGYRAIVAKNGVQEIPHTEGGQSHGGLEQHGGGFEQYGGGFEQHFR